MEKKNAVVILSGGLDSCTAAAVTRKEFFDQGVELDLYALSFHYGQRHAAELVAAENVAKMLGVKKHVTMPLEFGKTFGGSALTKDGIDVPENRSDAEIGTGIPITYVPCRNIIFLSIAAAWAETLKTNLIITGFNDIDSSGYPDTRAAFVDSFNDMLNVGTGFGDRGGKWDVRAPLIALHKHAIIKRGIELGIDYSLTCTCYQAYTDGNGNPVACGKCDACLLRKAGFEKAGVDDPTLYDLTGGVMS